ncbi:MAG: thiamine pyrophosphate-dependent enzyme [Candidatus Binatia bacterium]|jgi:2-oxoglutarate ferredoxin oxidoreductase subunit beta|nr:thiamine pyrophosphate-dependent enzyme [Candidatus Binatia bacterium]
MKTAEKKWVAGTPKLKIKIRSPIALCQGCQHGSAGRVIWEAIEELGVDEKTIWVGGVTCGTANAFLADLDAIGPVPHGRAPDIASAMKRLKGDEAVVLTYQGDGDAIAIGTESLIQAASRAERITVIMVNNANYGTTGGQMAPTTLIEQRTTTTPEGRSFPEGFPINTAELVAHLKGTVYSARGSLTSPANYRRTKKYIAKALIKQIDDIGFSFVEILSACPPNWGKKPVDCLKWIEDTMVVQYPLGEFKDLGRIE